MSERVAVVGSRNYPDLPEVFAYVCSLSPYRAVVSGGARGVDQTAEGAARAKGITVVSYRPIKRHDRWWIAKVVFVPGSDPEIILRAETFATFGQAAYFRNGLVVNDSDRVEVFWDGASPGARNTIALAEKAGKLGTVHRPSLTLR